MSTRRQKCQLGAEQASVESRLTLQHISLEPSPRRALYYRQRSEFRLVKSRLHAIEVKGLEQQVGERLEDGRTDSVQLLGGDGGDDAVEARGVGKGGGE